MVPDSWVVLGDGRCQYNSCIINGRGVKESLPSPRFLCPHLAAHPQPWSFPQDMPLW